MTDLVTYNVVDTIAIIYIDNPPVNALGIEVRSGLVDAMDRFDADTTAEAAIIIGAGRIFSAGADIKEFSAPSAAPRLSVVTRRFDKTTKPTIAAIHNAAFGGALELALGCQFRVCDSTTRIGFPEVTLGIFPGGSGTQRLPRLIGVKEAMKVIVSGDPLSAKEAFNLGIIDQIIEGHLQAGAMAFARQVLDSGRVAKKTCEPEAPLGLSDDDKAEITAMREFASQRMGGQNAPMRAIDSIENGLSVPLDEALDYDGILVDELKSTPQSKALRYAFFSERQVAKVPGIDKATPARTINTAAVIGSGTMGSGIAISLADAGISVTLIDQSDEALDRAGKGIASIYERMVKRGRISSDQRDARIARITKSTSYDNLADVDLVIEAVFENLDLKKSIFAQLDQICRPGTILATNSSSLDINLIAAATGRPQDVCGLHFFSPANVMRLLEIVRTDTTADDVIVTAMALAARIGKVGVLAGVCSGYIANRCRQPMVQEAMFLVEDGATPEQVDGALVKFGMPMGPLAVGDLSGTDISYSMRKSQQWKPGARYPFLADLIVDKGRHGRKTGMGWYSYGDDGRTPIPDPAFDQLAEEFRKQQGIVPATFTDDEILERCLLAAVNEGARILQEGIALRASDIDVMWVHGFAFPRHYGGIMHYADQMGLPQVYRKICKFHEQMGEQWAASELLNDLAEEDGSFTDT
jgi:3-hydroxyacyl-CoA dehydrogenase